MKSLNHWAFYSVLFIEPLYGSLTISASKLVHNVVPLVLSEEQKANLSQELGITVGGFHLSLRERRSAKRR